MDETEFQKHLHELTNNVVELGNILFSLRAKNVAPSETEKLLKIHDNLCELTIELACKV